MERFYIGSLELKINSDEQFDICQWDKPFTFPVLPVYKRAELNIHITSDISSVRGKEYRAPGMLIYENNLEEWRVYGVSEKNTDKEFSPQVISHRTSDDLIDLFIERKWWATRQKSFRPWFYTHIEELLLENRSLILHSASIICQGYAILFTAPSGTGKTTQTDLWHHFLNEIEDINGDRTLIQHTSDGWYAAGFPVFGSNVRCEQKSASIKAIIILRQGIEDEIIELSPAQKLSLLYSEITVPNFKKHYTEMAMALLEELIVDIPVLLYSCTMKESAVTTLYHYLYGGPEDGTI